MHCRTILFLLEGPALHAEHCVAISVSKKNLLRLAAAVENITTACAYNTVDTALNAWHANCCTPRAVRTGSHFLNTMQLHATTEERSGEGTMSVLLSSLMALVIAQQVFALPLSLAPGMSLENALLYIAATALAFKFAVQRNFQFELRGLHTAFAVLIGYAALSIPAVALLQPFDGYRPLPAVLAFKSRLVDHFVFFAVFFYGLRGTRSALNVLKALLVMTAVANLIALLAAWGFVEAPGLVDRDDGRIQGVMGESNQSAAFIAAFLPALVAMSFTTKGPARLMWIGGATVSAAAMTISASRGGFLATIVTTLWGLYYFRRHISGRAIAIATIVGGLVLLIMLPIIASRYGFLLFSRVVEDSTSSNLAGASSGRLVIWATALNAMAEAPLSFLTGYGWNAYEVMPFRYNTHNHFVSLWFDLGLVGLISGTAVLVIAMKSAIRAVPHASNMYRPILMAFAIGALAITIATFFVNLYTPWLWFWAYAGLALRIAANVYREHAQAGAPEDVRAGKAVQKDPFGWIGTPAPGTGR
jgi:hypothetical protein